MTNIGHSEDMVAEKLQISPSPPPSFFPPGERIGGDSLTRLFHGLGFLGGLVREILNRQRKRLRLNPREPPNIRSRYSGRYQRPDIRIRVHVDLEPGGIGDVQGFRSVSGHEGLGLQDDDINEL